MSVLVMDVVGSTSEKMGMTKSEIRVLDLSVEWNISRFIFSGNEKSGNLSVCPELTWQWPAVSELHVTQCPTRPRGLSSDLASSVTHTPVSTVIDVTDDIQIVITFGISKTKHYWQYFVRLVIGRALTFIFIFKGFEINAICVRKRLVMEM